MTVDAEFAELFATRAAAVRRTAFLLCGDWAQAEDLTQTAFAKLYAAWPRLRDPGAAEAYLRRIVARAHVDESRRPWRRERPTAELPDAPSPGDGTDERVVLLAALAAVPRRQRACLVLRYFEDCSVTDTAAALRCSEGTVKSNTARGLDALRAALGGVLPDLTTARDSA
ncbi:MAG TPA: SigE family RNA polymerase sigma factor [Frankiaceae bacterium]|nr:SigE family RNA polymerase sigma factor [Frankiaceae bacterium]